MSTELKCKFCYSLIDISQLEDSNIQAISGFNYAKCPQCGEFIFIPSDVMKELLEDQGDKDTSPA